MAQQPSENGNSKVRTTKPDSDIFETYVSHQGLANNGETFADSWTLFREWFSQSSCEHLSELAQSDLSRFETYLTTHPERDRNKNSVAKALKDIRAFINWARPQGYVVKESMDWEWDSILPDRTKAEKQRSGDDTMDVHRGKEITRWVRSERYGEREHVQWILIWGLGLRLSACLALDRDDFHIKPEGPNCDCEDPKYIEGPHLRLRHRPDLCGEKEGLGLKRCGGSNPDSRVLPLNRRQKRAIFEYLKQNPKHDQPDEYGLHGLIQSSTTARLSEDGFRKDIYQLTSPATFRGECDCSYCRDRDGYLKKEEAHLCEESYSPHPCRHGAIQRMIDITEQSRSQVTLSDVEHMVGTGEETLKDVYDETSEGEAFQRHGNALREDLA